MRATTALFAPVLLLVLAEAGPAAAQTAPSGPDGMSFFVTSTRGANGADYGGLAGADRHCATLAEAAGAAAGRTWRAYLSTQASGSEPAVNARDRIGKGPWRNVKGEVIATSVEDLHSDANKLTKATALTEKGGTVNGRGDTPNEHDILTGSQADGTAFAPGEDRTCRNWTSSAEGAAMTGHHDRIGTSGATATSWNAAHPSRGCSYDLLKTTGGAGYLYCVAAQ